MSDAKPEIESNNENENGCSMLHNKSIDTAEMHVTDVA